jgi:hypothetical protein
MNEDERRLSASEDYGGMNDVAGLIGSMDRACSTSQLSRLRVSRSKVEGDERD